jgi:mannosyltransferase OCH1-like enzyme
MDAYVRNEWGDTPFAEAYFRINPRYGAARADIFRYLAVYRTGGFYLDSKSNVDAIDDLAALAEGRNGYPALHYYDPWSEFVNWYLLDAAGSAVLGRALATAARNIREFHGREGPPEKSGRMAVLWTTGPKVYTQAVKDASRELGVRLAGTSLDERDMERCGLRFSCFGNDSEHQNATGKSAVHYSEVSEPVVLEDPSAS